MGAPQSSISQKVDSKKNKNKIKQKQNMRPPLRYSQRRPNDQQYKDAKFSRVKSLTESGLCYNIQKKLSTKVNFQAVKCNLKESF
jgi:hypothetical protein